MANHPILIKHGTLTDFDIDLNSLATATAKQSALVATNDYPAALIFLRMRSGSVAPTAGSAYKVYLLRFSSATSPALADDNAATTKGTITLEEARQIDSIIVTATTAKDFRKVIDTSGFGNLGPAFAIAVYNDTGQTTDSTAGNFLAKYILYAPEVR